MFVAALAPPSVNYMGAISLLPAWTLCGVIVALLASLPIIHRTRSDASPIRALAALVKTNWQSLAVVFVGFELAGLNMIAFMWAKPLLNYLVPFSADPFLASLDRALFFGRQPDLSFLNSNGFALFYHRGWFAMMIAALLYVLTRRPSQERTALLLTYFALWTFVGPIIHTILPAGGPIFYERLGHGPFDVSGAPITNELADYLWRLYTSGGFGPGAGISAMPSLHIATTAWVCLVAKGVWRWPTYAASFLIFVLSVSLGWHYAVDGIFGAIAALALFRLLSPRAALPANGRVTIDPGRFAVPNVDNGSKADSGERPSTSG